MFFIVGRGRSGTTLLGSLLDAHPGVFVAPESLFVMNAYRRYGRGRWTAVRRRRFLADLWREERMRRWRLDPASLEELLDRHGEDTSLARVCATVYLASARSHGRADPLLLGDKNPLYALFVPELLELYPEACFVHVVRDYRDNVLSFRNVPFDLDSVGALAYRWRRYNQAILDAAAGREDRFLLVRFEDLVRRPDEELERSFRFLGVDPEPGLPCVRRSRTEAALPWHGHLSGPIDAGQVEKWRTALEPRLLAQADSLCQPLGRRFGYAPASGPVGPKARLQAVLGATTGAAFTAAEKLLFRLPLELRAAAIRTYRVATGNPIA